MQIREIYQPWKLYGIFNSLSHLHTLSLCLSISFLRQVQDETLRLSTLGPWAARYSDKDITIEGHVIPVATPIIQALGVGLKSQVSWEDVDK